jgi:hypothetical protein
MRTTSIIIGSLFISAWALARPQEPYSADLAVTYARQWATSRNSSYPNVSPEDCTNFISQALRNGGWRNTATTSSTSDTLWWLRSKTSYSQTWSTANGLFRHLNGGYGVTAIGKASYESWFGWPSATSVNYGDVVFGDWQGDGLIDHTMIVTGFKRLPNGTLEPRFSYHSTDQKDIALTDLKNRLGPAILAKTKFYRFGSLNACVAPKKYQIF